MIYKITPGGIMDQDYLMHHGIKGQKWGERRFQNPDGSLTPEGMRRYNQYKEKYGEKTAARLMRSMNKGDSEKRAMQREYNRRKWGNMPRKVATAEGLGLAGSAATSIPLYVLSKKGAIDEEVAISISRALGILHVAGGSLAATQIDKVANGYSNFDISKKGLQKFYDDMKNARDD